DGGIERGNPRRAWPRWAEVGDDAMLGDSVDHLLEGLLTDFTLTNDGRQRLPGSPDGSRTFKHVRGDRKEGAHRPQPQRVDLWIDPGTNVLERLEMTWPKPPEGPDGGPAGAKRAPGDGRDGPQGDGPRPDRPGPDGPDARPRRRPPPPPPP